MDNVDEVNQNFNVKKPKKKGLIICLVIILTLIVAAGLVYFLVLSRPQRVFDAAIDKLFKTESVDFDSVKIKLGLKASAKVDVYVDEDVQSILDEIGKCTFDFGTQLDLEKKQELVDLGLKYDNQEVINGRVYYNDGDLYMYLNELFDKYIKIDLEEEQIQAFDEIFEIAASKENIKNSQKAMKIIGNELKSSLKEYGEFSKEKDTIEVDGEDVKVTKSIVELSGKDMIKMFSSICSNLSKNDKFLECFEDKEVRNELKEGLKTSAESLENSNIEDAGSMTIAIFTKGFLNKFVGVEAKVTVNNGYSKETMVASFLEEGEDKYSYTISQVQGKEKVDIVKALIEIDKDVDKKDEKEGKATITITVPQAGSIKLEIDYALELNNGVDKVNVDDSVSINGITEEDAQAAILKLQDRPLIKDLINTFSTVNSTQEDFITDDIEIEKPAITTQENQVKYDKYSVTYSIPTNYVYKSDYSTDYIKFYQSGSSNSGIDAAVSVNWTTEDIYKKNNPTYDYDYYKNETTYYKNVSLGEEKSVTVGNNTFKYQILSYEANSEYYEAKYQKAYVWYKLDNEYLFVVELESTDSSITEDTIKGFLNITTAKAN